MNDYDAFMNEMLEAGWTWEEALSKQTEREYGIDTFYIPDLFDRD